MKVILKILWHVAVLAIASMVPLSMNAASWYVDPAATGSKNGTSWANAWTSFAAISWSSVAAGDTIYISGGTTSQTYTTPLNIGASGKAGSPITISAGQDAGHNGVAILDAGGSSNAMIAIGGYQYVTITGNYNGAQNIRLQNGNLSADSAILTGSGAGCSSYPCPASAFAQGITITYIEISGAGDGITFNYPYGIVISHSYIHNIGDDHAIAVNGSADFMSGALWGLGASIHDNVIQVNNTSVSAPNSGDGPDALSVSNGADVYNNVIYGAQGTTVQSQHQDGVQWDGNYERVYNNTFYCLANSVSEGDQYDKTLNTQPDGHYWFYDNVVGQCAGQSNSHGWETTIHTSSSPPNLAVTAVTDYQFWNNTVTDMTGYAFIYLWNMTNGVTLTNSSAKNNIIYDVGEFFNLSGGNYTCGSDFVIDHNNINNGKSGGEFGTNTCNGNAYTPTNTQTGAPSFASYTQYAPGTNSLLLQAGSTADIGTGVNLTTDFTTDKNANARPSTGAWDMGAYISGSSNTSQPVPPTNVQAVAQ